MEGAIILDACCVLNLAATGCFEEILRCLPYRFHVGRRVRGEAQWLRVPDSEDRELVDLQFLLGLELLQEHGLEDAREEALFVEFGTVLDDGEAEAAALAVSRHFALATDDHKARRVVSERYADLRLFSTLELIREWHVRCAIPTPALVEALHRVAYCATYRPQRTDPLADWWDALMRER